MATTTVAERLAEMYRQIEELELKARTAAGETRARVRRQLDALRELAVSARAAATDDIERFREKSAHFDARLHVARSAVATELAEGHQTFAAAVEKELREWDTYFERLQAQTALRAAHAREQSEAAIRDLRRRRAAVADRLAALRDASADDWNDQKERIAAAREELEEKADELSATFK